MSTPKHHELLSLKGPSVAVIDLAGYIAGLKDQAVEHGFHVHDERHFVETYSMRQAWEVDLHPEAACGGPLDLHLAVELDPRVLLAFEDHIMELREAEEPEDRFKMSALDTYASVTDPAERSLTIVARVEVSLSEVFMGTENLSDELEKCGVVSEFLLDRAPAWLED